MRTARVICESLNCTHHWDTYPDLLSSLLQWETFWCQSFGSRRYQGVTLSRTLYGSELRAWGWWEPGEGLYSFRMTACIMSSREPTFWSSYHGLRVEHMTVVEVQRLLASYLRKQPGPVAAMALRIRLDRTVSLFWPNNSYWTKVEASTATVEQSCKATACSFLHHDSSTSVCLFIFTTWRHCRVFPTLLGTRKNNLHPFFPVYQIF